MLRGAEKIRSTIESYLNIQNGETTTDGLFTLTEFECLGACCNAPMVQINDEFYEDLTPESMISIIELLRAYGKAKKGSQLGRKCSEPFGGPHVLQQFLGDANA